MAKKMMDMSMTCMQGQCGPKCLVLGLLSAVLAAGGLWMIVGGIGMQWTLHAPWTNVLLWYTGGMLLGCIAKMAKMKCCGMCNRM